MYKPIDTCSGQDWTSNESRDSAAVYAEQDTNSQSPNSHMLFAPLYPYRGQHRRQKRGGLAQWRTRKRCRVASQGSAFRLAWNLCCLWGI